jgi:hypothetical protein
MAKAGVKPIQMEREGKARRSQGNTEVWRQYEGKVLDWIGGWEGVGWDIQRFHGGYMVVMDKTRDGRN